MWDVEGGGWGVRMGGSGVKELGDAEGKGTEEWSVNHCQTRWRDTRQVQAVLSTVCISHGAQLR